MTFHSAEGGFELPPIVAEQKHTLVIVPFSWSTEAGAIMFHLNSIKIFIHETEMSLGDST